MPPLLALRRGQDSGPESLAAKNHHAHLFTVTQVLSGSLQALLRALCDELGVVPGGSIHDVESRLLKFYYSTPVVILDEAQNLAAEITSTAASP